MSRLLIIAALLSAPAALLGAQSGPPAAPAAAAFIERSGEYYQIASAWRGEQPALGLMFEYVHYAAMPRAAAAQHGRVLLALLRHLGDSAYAVALLREVPYVHRDVLQALQRAAGRDSITLPREYPLTFGPRRPGEPSVEACAERMRSAHARAESLQATLMDSFPPLMLPRSAPDSLRILVTVDAAGRPEFDTLLLWPQVDVTTEAAVVRSIGAWRFKPALIGGCAWPSQYQRAIRR